MSESIHLGIRQRKKQLRRNKEQVLERNDLGEKQCTRCKQWKHLDYFKPDYRTSDQVQSWCGECTNISEHQIRIEDRELMIMNQNSKCLICFKDLNLPNSYPTIDHDHSHCNKKHGCSECIRGVLCNHCNLGLGHFKDNIETIKQAIKYLEESKNV